MGTSTIPSANTVQSEILSIPCAEPVAIQQLAKVSDQIHRITREAEALLIGRPEAELGIRLEGGSWCVAECLGHLTQTTRAFLPAISEAIAEAQSLTRNRPLRTGILAELFIRNLNPPYRIRLKVLPQLAPQNTDAATAWADFVKSQSELLGTVRSSAGLSIDKVRIKSPVYARVSYNIYGAFRMLVAHQNRHLWQIEQILKALDGRTASGVA